VPAGHLAVKQGYHRRSVRRRHRRSRGRGGTRRRLRAAIADLDAANRRLAELEAGQQRANVQLRDARPRLSEATRDLEQAQRTAPNRLVDAFVGGAALAADDAGVIAAEIEAKAAQVEVDRLDKLSAAIGEEIARVQSSMRLLRSTHLERSAAVIAASVEYAGLVAAHSDAYRRLRSIKATLRVVAGSLKGYASQSMQSEPYRDEPTEADRIGFEVDREFVAQWSEAMAKLEVNADAELPA
jgi:hypothetical protein